MFLPLLVASCCVDDYQVL